MNESKREKIRDLLQNTEMPKEEIARECGVSPGSVSAIKAHITMGTYEKNDSDNIVDTHSISLERDVEEHLVENLDKIEEGLSLLKTGSNFILILEG